VWQKINLRNFTGGSVKYGAISVDKLRMKGIKEDITRHTSNFIKYKRMKAIIVNNICLSICRCVPALNLQNTFKDIN